MAIPVKVLFGLLTVAQSTLACSAPFSIKNSACVFFSSTKATWCDAQRQCRQIGGELLTGSNARLAIQNGILDSTVTSSDTKFFFVGITDMSDERKTSRSGWKFADGSLAPSNLDWASPGEPGKGTFNQDCLSFGEDNVFYDYHCYKEDNYICQPAAFSPKTQQQFKMTDVFVSTNPEHYAAGACSKNFTLQRNTHCAARCLQEDACVSFYFNRQRSACLLVLFTDARLDVGSTEGWEKYVFAD